MHDADRQVLFQLDDCREIAVPVNDSQLILPRERGRQVDVVCSVGEEGHLEHHVVAVEQLYVAIGVVVVEVEGVVLQCHVGAVGGKVRRGILRGGRIQPPQDKMQLDNLLKSMNGTCLEGEQGSDKSS